MTAGQRTLPEMVRRAPASLAVFDLLAVAGRDIRDMPAAGIEGLVIKGAAQCGLRWGVQDLLRIAAGSTEGQIKWVLLQAGQ